MVKVDRYIQSRGDIVWLDFSPCSGHEQSGQRPSLCISQKEYNQKTGLALFCPCTSIIKGYPFEVLIQDTGVLHGVILADQIKSLDWRVRNISYITTLPEPLLIEVMAKISVLVG